MDEVTSCPYSDLTRACPPPPPLGSEADGRGRKPRRRRRRRRGPMVVAVEEGGVQGGRRRAAMLRVCVCTCNAMEEKRLLSHLPLIVAVEMHISAHIN